MRRRFAELRAKAQSRLRELENHGWQDLAKEIQGYADSNNMQKFYENTKRLYGPTKRAIMTVRTTDGQTLIRDQEGILKRWAEHFNQLLNNCTTTDHSTLDNLPSLSTQTNLDQPPSLLEVSEAIEGLKPRKAPGPGKVPLELLVGWGLEMHRFMHQMIFQIWQGESIPGS